jgi:hypothetical protein
MKYLYIVLYVFLISCSVSKNNYVCGDHVCVDKKEFKEYFAANLSIEVQEKKKRKDNSIDLAKLNSGDNTDIYKEDLILKKNTSFNKKEEKKRINLERKRLKKERKIKKIEEKKKIKEEKKLIKLKNNDIKNKNSKVDKKMSVVKISSKKKINSDLKKKDIKKLQEVKAFKSTKSKNQVGVCSEIEDCNIDKISDLLSKKGEKKGFPDITSK